jgi:hypothetical protein
MIICEASMPRAGGERKYHKAVILIRMAYARQAFYSRLAKRA